MAAFVEFEDFSEELAKGTHQLHAAGHILKVYLTNNAPNAATHAVLADLAGITEQNGYAAADIQNDISRTGPTTLLTGVDVTFSASGAGFGPFRYAVIRNSSVAGEPLIGYADYGSSISINGGDQFVVDFGASILTIN